METLGVRKKLLQAMLSLVVFLAFWPASFASSATESENGTAPPPKRIVVFQSLSVNSLFSNMIYDTMVQELTRNLDFQVCREVIDLASHRSPQYVSLLSRLLEIKYKNVNRSPDLLVTLDDHALEFLLGPGKRLFPQTPVLASNTIVPPANLKASGRQVSIIRDGFAVADTVLVANRMFPQLEQIILVAENGNHNPQALIDEATSQLEGFSNHFKITPLRLNNVEDIKNQIPRNAPRTMVLILDSPSSHVGPFSAHMEHLRKLLQHIESPIFVLNYAWMGSGVIGGKMVGPKELGREIARQSMIILADHKSQPTSVTLTQFFFDQSALTRFSIGNADLPANSVILNHPQLPPYSKLFSWLPLIAAAFMAESLLLLGLFFLYRKNSTANRELERRERQWQSLTENLPDIIYRIDSKGQCQYINRSVERTLDLKVEDLIGKTARYLRVPSSDPDFTGDDTQEVFLSGQPRTKEITINSNRGPIILESRLVPEPDLQGRIVNVLGISRDVTKEKKASRELALQQFVIASTQMPIIIVNRDDKIHFANAAAVQMFNGDAGGLEGRRFDSFSLWSDEFADAADLLETVRTKRTLHVSGEYRGDATPLPIEMIFNRMHLESDEFICLFIRDISQQKKVEQELKQAKERAEKSDQLKSSFLANVSHEIRTPLNGILGFAELLKYSDPEDEERTKYIDIINESGKTLLQIIEDILDISKIESGQIKVNSSEFQLMKMLDELYQIFNHKLMTSPNGKVELRLQVPEHIREDGLPVCADEIRLRQILNNLISNAIKFTHEGFVEIGCHLLDHQVEIYVKDTGIGIPADKQREVFEPFRQADESISRTYGGTGLGLAIASSYAKLMGGSIKLKSHEGQGSTFTLSFPRGTEPAIPAETVAAQPRRRDYRWPNGKVLVAEDDRTSFLFIKKIISDTGATVIHVESGSEAVRLCQVDYAIDAVLMDIRLPDLNGWEATRKIKSRRPNLPIIIETANALNQDRVKSADCGSDGFLTKPIRKEELLDALAPFMEKR